MPRNSVLIFSAILLAAAGGLTACSSQENLDTPSGVADAYLNALEEGDLDKAMELTVTDHLEAATGAVQIEAPDERISNVEVREETHDEGVPIVAATYELGGQKMSTRITLGQVTVDGKPAYVVTNELPVISLEENAPFQLNGADVASGVALVIPGVYEIERDLKNEFLADSKCQGSARVILGADGAVETEIESPDDCLTATAYDMQPSGEAADRAKAEIQTAVDALFEKCSEACDRKSMEPVGPGQLGEIPEGCFAAFGGVDCGSLGGEQARAFKGVSLVRFTGSSVPEVSLSFPDAQGTYLVFRTDPVDQEECQVDCGNSDSWTNESYGEPISRPIMGSYKNGEITFD